MNSEFKRFLLFILLLSLIASMLANFRARDRVFAFADGGITDEIKAEKVNIFTGSLNSYLTFWGNIFTVGGGLTSAGEPIYSHILVRLLPTFHLAIFSILFGSFFGIFLSLLPVFLKNKFLDGLLTRIAEIILSTPVFVFAILLLILFFYRWDLFPPGGYETLNTYYVILPGLALGMRVFARIYIFQSNEAWKESKSGYVLLLQSRGYPWKHIVFSEIFRKVLPQTFVIIILDFGSLLSGAMIVEEIFFYPGIGKSIFFSIKAMDTQLLATLLLYTGVIFYIINRVALSIQKYFLSAGTQGNE